MFKLEDIFIKRSPIHPNAWVFHIEMNGFQFSGYFDSWSTFIQAVREAVAFFAFKAGKLTPAQAAESLTRSVS